MRQRHGHRKAAGSGKCSMFLTRRSMFLPGPAPCSAADVPNAASFRFCILALAAAQLSQDYRRKAPGEKLQLAQ